MSGTADGEDWECGIYGYEIEVLESAEYLAGDEDLGGRGGVGGRWRWLSSKVWWFGWNYGTFTGRSYRSLWLVFTLADTASRLRTAGVGM
jgi:hypothetical protein